MPRGNITLQESGSVASLLPSLFTTGALVETGHGLIRGPKLDHQEERLLVVAERTGCLRAHNATGVKKVEAAPRESSNLRRS